MRPSDHFYDVITVETAAGVAVTGLLDASFTVTGYNNGTVFTVTKTVTEISGGRYKLDMTMPATAGFLTFFVSNSTNIVTPSRYEGELEAADMDALYAAASVPVATISATGSPSVDTPLVFDAYRYHDCSATRYTAAGAVQDLTGYTNPRFAVWDRTHSISLYSLSTGITLGGVAGTIVWSVPENAAFFSQIDAAITAGQDTVTLYYDLVADKGGVAAQTMPLLRGTITLRRFEAAP